MPPGLDHNLRAPGKTKGPWRPWKTAVSQGTNERGGCAEERCPQHPNKAAWNKETEKEKTRDSTIKVFNSWIAQHLKRYSLYPTTSTTSSLYNIHGEKCWCGTVEDMMERIWSPTWAKYRVLMRFFSKHSNNIPSEYLLEKKVPLIK